MRKEFEPYIKLLPYAAIGLALLAIAVAAIFYVQRGAHVVLDGSVQKVRTLALDERASGAIIDFRVRNPSDYTFIVREIEVTMVDREGREWDSILVAEADAHRLFEYFPALGQKFNETLTRGDQVPAGESADRMLAVRFEVPEQEFQARQELRIRIRETANPTITEIIERPN